MRVVLGIVMVLIVLWTIGSNMDESEKEIDKLECHMTQGYEGAEFEDSCAGYGDFGWDE